MLAVSLFLIFLGAAFKNDTDSIRATMYWSDLATGPVTSAIKSYSIALIGVGALLSLMQLRRIISIRQLDKPLFLLLAVQLLYAPTRALASDPDFAFKVALGSLLFLVIYFQVAATVNAKGLEVCSEQILVSILMFGAVLIACNTADYINGLGFVPGTPRMFGSASHPNFFGVQLSIVCAACCFATLHYRTWLLRVVLPGMLAAGCVLLYLTGSRTGVLAFIASLFTILWFRMGRATNVVLLPVLVVAAIILYYWFASAEVGMDHAFYRGQQSNTRTAVWAAMAELIEQEPLVGHGIPVGNTENSFLRGAIIYGLPFMLVQLAIAVILLVRSTKTMMTARFSAFGFLNMLVYLLLSAAVFEGFLADSLSLSVVVYYAALAIGAGVRDAASPGVVRNRCPADKNRRFAPRHTGF